MPIKLTVEVDAPLSPDDRDLLAGIAVMVLAIANRELAQQGFPGVFPTEEEPAPPPDPHDEGPDQESGPEPGRPN